MTSLPITFILLEMILRSTSSDAQLRLQAMHTLSILTAPDRCRAVLAAPSLAATLPLLGAVVSSSKALRAEGWKLESLGVAMKLLTVIASNVFQLVGELSNSRGSVLTSSSTGKQQDREEATEQNQRLQKQGQQQGLKQKGEEQGRQQQQGRQQEQGQKQQRGRIQKQEELEPIAQLPDQAQLDGLIWVGWHCILGVGTTTGALTALLSCIAECRRCSAGERQGLGGEVAAGAGGDHTAGGERQGLGGEGVIGGDVNKGSPPAMDEGFYTVPMPASITDRCLSLLEDLLYAEGVAGVSEALAEAAANSGEVHRTRGECLFRLLQELSSSNSAAGAGAGAALREDGTACAGWKGAETAAGSAASAGTSATSAASAKTAAGAAAGAVAAAVPLVLCPAAPSVLGDILAAAALGSDIEMNFPKESIRLKSQIVEARLLLLAHLDFGGGMAQGVGSTTAAVKDTAFELLRHLNVLALRGTKRPIGFSCNNPKCGNLEGFSEVGLVVPGVKGAPRGKGAGVCEMCKAACYCSRECQWHHLKMHRAYCGLSLEQQQEEEIKGEVKQQ
jgi:hypothetical protein